MSGINNIYPLIGMSRMRQRRKEGENKTVSAS